jgi:hypothetical protein
MEMEEPSTKFSHTSRALTYHEVLIHRESRGTFQFDHLYIWLWRSSRDREKGGSRAVSLRLILVYRGYESC